MIYYRRIHPSKLNKRVEPNSFISYIHLITTDEWTSEEDYHSKIIGREAVGLAAIDWLVEQGYVERREQ